MGDRVFALVLMVIVAAFWWESGELPGPSGGAVVGPAFLPRAVLGLIFGLAVLLLIQSFVKSQEATSFKGIGEFFKVHWRVPVLLAAVGAYIVLMTNFGFVIASILFLVGAFALLIQEYTRGVIITSVVVAVGLPIGIEWVFESALSTVLP